MNFKFPNNGKGEGWWAEIIVSLTISALAFFLGYRKGKSESKSSKKD